MTRAVPLVPCSGFFAAAGFYRSAIQAVLTPLYLINGVSLMPAIAVVVRSNLVVGDRYVLISVGYADDLQVGEGTELLGLYEDDFVHFYMQTGDYLGTTEIENVETVKRLQSGTASITVKEVVQRQDEVFLQLLIPGLKRPGLHRV